MSPDLLAAGGVTVDNIVTADGRVFPEQLGGNAVHAAVGAALWRISVGIAGRVPADFPVALLSDLSGSGLFCDALWHEAASAPMQEWFFHGSDGSRRDHLHATTAEARAAGIVDQPIDGAVLAAWEQRLACRPARAETFAAFRRAHAVTPETIPEHAWPMRGLHVGPGEPEAMLALARAGRARGLTVTLDPGFAAGRFGHAFLDAVLETVDVFLPSEKELAVLFPDVAPQTALRELSARAGCHVCAKFGSDGALLIERGAATMMHVPTVPVLAIDPVGAGDAFAGGLLAALVSGAGLVVAACSGAVSASFTVATVGALAPLAAAAEEAERRRIALLPRVVIGERG